MIQTIGRSARNVNAKVILYGDVVTEAMKDAIQETARRRKLQEAFNKANNITPKSIKKNISAGIAQDLKSHRDATEAVIRKEDEVYITEEYIGELQTEMLKAAEDLEFERAGALRDRISHLQEAIGQPLSAVENAKPKKGKGRRGKRRRAKVPRPRKKD